MVDLRFKYRSHGVPQLSNAEIEGHVVQLIRDFAPDLLHNPQALDVEMFAENYLGLQLDYADLSHKGFIWGRMVFNNTLMVVWNPETQEADERPVDDRTIVIDNSLLDDGKERIFRSTVAHECGHGVYHDEYFCLDTLSSSLGYCTSHVPYTRCKEGDIVGSLPLPGRKKRFSSDHEWLEHQAKYFSAALLMNKPAMQTLCHDARTKQFCFDKYPGFENDALIRLVSDCFNVSVTSAKIRIETLKLYLPGCNDNEYSYYNLGTPKYSPVFC